MDCQFYVVSTDSHQPLLNHFLPPARGCWQSPLPVLGVPGAAQNLGGVPISAGFPMLVLRMPSAEPERTQKQASSARKYIPSKVEDSFQEIMSLLPLSFGENQWEES